MKANAHRQQQVIALLAVKPMTSRQIADAMGHDRGKISTALAAMCDSRRVSRIAKVAQVNTRGVYLFAVFGTPSTIALPSERRGRQPVDRPPVKSEFQRAGPVYCRQFKWRIGRTV